MRILLADDSQAVRAALRLLLEQQSGHQVAGEARDAINLLAQVTRQCPDAVILDTELPGILPQGRGALRSLSELVETLRMLCPQVRIIALSSGQKPASQYVFLQADALLCKSDPPDALLKILLDFADPAAER
jgi:DNA-binding NarL/FixJ family response regulator